MASSKGFLEFVLDQLSSLKDITYRYMMGEYVIYYKGYVCAWVLDDRLFVKPTKHNQAYYDLHHITPTYEQPYKGNNNKWILVNEIENSEFVVNLIKHIVNNAPQSKKRRKK